LRTLIGQSAAHYWIESPYNPRRIPHGPETEAQLIGRAIHEGLNGEEEFNRRFIVRPDHHHGMKWDSKRGDCKNWLATVPGNRAVLTPQQKETIDGVLWQVANHPQIGKPNKILSGWVEHSLFWKDHETGIWLKARPDVIPTDGDFDAVCDLKTTRSVLYPDLVKTIQDYGYHQQAALTRTAFGALFGIKLRAFTFLFVEKTPPHCIALVELRPEELDRGEAQNRAALQLFKMCKDRSEWPGPIDEDYLRIGLSERYHEYADRRVKQITAEWRGQTKRKVA
jgi:hypothetical protein